MISAHECFHQAAKCEQMAEEATNEADRKDLLAEAAQWFTRGNEATLKEVTDSRGDS